MYRVKILTLMVSIVAVGIAIMQYYGLPLNVGYYSRAASGLVADLEQEFGRATLAGILFGAAIFGVVLFQRRT